MLTRDIVRHTTREALRERLNELSVRGDDRVDVRADRAAHLVFQGGMDFAAAHRFARRQAPVTGIGPRDARRHLAGDALGHFLGERPVNLGQNELRREALGDRPRQKPTHPRGEVPLIHALVIERLTPFVEVHSRGVGKQAAAAHLKKALADVVDVETTDEAIIRQRLDTLMEFIHEARSEGFSVEIDISLKLRHETVRSLCPE